MIQKYVSRLIFIFVGILSIAFAAGCGLTPQFSYQGKLTDANGTPLNGTFTITFKLFDASSAGTEIYTQTKSVTVNDGLFEVEIGPSDATGTLDPESLTQPLWLELTINDGSVTETLAPRQRLYGAPYAFTLMAGSVISGDMDTIVFGSQNIKSVLTVQNTNDGTTSNPALPALRVIGETGIELSSPISTSGTGLLTSNLSGTNSDLAISSNDEVIVYLDADNNSVSHFTVINSIGDIVFQVREDGTYFHKGSSTTIPITPNSVEEPSEGSSIEGATDVQGLLASSNTTSALLEDFGSSTLANGLIEVTLEATFAESLQSNNYYVFITPLGDCNGLFIAEKSENSFIVKELGNGASNISFDYRVVAKLAEKE